MVTLQSLLRDKAFYRDVAQLVAHYVRDVGVGRSSRLIPTIRGLKRWLQRFNPCRFKNGRKKFGTVLKCAKYYV